MVEEFGLIVIDAGLPIDASHSIGAVFAALRQQMEELLSPAPVVSRDSIGRLKPLRNGTARPAVLGVEWRVNRVASAGDWPSADGDVESSVVNSDRRMAVNKDWS
jgi:hypothetical protein